MLLERGFKVIVYDIFAYGSESLASCIHDRNLKLIKGDVLDEPHLRQVMEGADIIVHLAAIVGYPACDKDPVLAQNVNVEGTRNIVTNITKSQKLIFSSTGSCYGSIKDGFCTEETPLNPLTLYGRSKAEGETLTLSVDGVCLRLATIFGVSPRMRLDLLINDFTYKALIAKKLEVYEGHFKRTFVHVRDVARAFIFAMDNYELMKGQVYNIGSDENNCSKVDVCYLIRDCLPFVKIVDSNCGSDADKRDYQVSYKKIGALGYKPQVNLKDGVKELCKILPYFSVESLDKMKNV
jgi:nucleoside-diphosphate-sugar epimerase